MMVTTCLPLLHFLRIAIPIPVYHHVPSPAYPQVSLRSLLMWSCHGWLSLLCCAAQCCTALLVLRDLCQWDACHCGAFIGWTLRSRFQPLAADLWTPENGMLAYDGWIWLNTVITHVALKWFKMDGPTWLTGWMHQKWRVICRSLKFSKYSNVWTRPHPHYNHT